MPYIEHVRQGAQVILLDLGDMLMFAKVQVLLGVTPNPKMPQLCPIKVVCLATPCHKNLVI
jgi:hypothetical protein